MGETAGANGVLAIQLGPATVLFGDARSAPAGLDEAGLAAAAGGAIAGRFGRAVPVLYARQVHGRLSYTYSGAQPLAAGGHLVGACDALLTAEPWTGLTVRTADCLPVALAGGGVAAIVHAGWRGLAADVLGAAVRRLGAEFGVAPAALDAAVGVGVGPCHYRVGAEVGDALARLATADGGWRGTDTVDLGRFAVGRLAALGLDRARVRALPGCTACSPAHHSYRRDGAAAGRQWSAVIVTGAAPGS